MGFFDKAKDAIKEVLAPPASTVRPAPELTASAALPELAAAPTESAPAAEPAEQSPSEQPQFVPPAEQPADQVAESTDAVEATPEPDVSQGRLPVYTVKSGDTLDQIAQRYGVDPMDIARLNHLETPERVLPGMVFKIPATDQPE